MTLPEWREEIEYQLTITKNKKSIERLIRVRELLHQAEILWLQSGKQAEALRCEEQAREILRDSDNY